MTQLIRVSLGSLQLTHQESAGWLLSSPDSSHRKNLTLEERERLVTMLRGISYRKWPDSQDNQREIETDSALIATEDEKDLSLIQRLGPPWFYILEPETNPDFVRSILIPMYGMKFRVESENLCPTFPSSWWYLEKIELRPTQDGNFIKIAIYPYRGRIHPPSNLTDFHSACPYRTDDENQAKFDSYKETMDKIYAQIEREKKLFARRPY